MTEPHASPRIAGGTIGRRPGGRSLAWLTLEEGLRRGLPGDAGTLRATGRVTPRLASALVCRGPGLPRPCLLAWLADAGDASVGEWLVRESGIGRGSRAASLQLIASDPGAVTQPPLPSKEAGHPPSASSVMSAVSRPGLRTGPGRDSGAG